MNGNWLFSRVPASLFPSSRLCRRCLSRSLVRPLQARFPLNSLPHQPTSAPLAIRAQPHLNSDILPKLFKNSHQQPSSPHDVLPVNHSSFLPDPLLNPSYPDRQHGYPNRPRTSPSTTTHSNNALTQLSPSPRTPLQDILTHHGLPQSLPPLPRTTPLPTLDRAATPQPTAAANLTALHSSYMSMLSMSSPSQASTCFPMTSEVHSSTSDSGRMLDALFDADVLLDADPPFAAFNFDTLFEEHIKTSQSPLDPFGVCASAVEPSSTAFGSPESPFDTPALGFSPSSVMDTSPALRDIDDDDMLPTMPLFGFSSAPPPSHDAKVTEPSDGSILGLNMLDGEGLISMATPTVSTVAVPSLSDVSSSSSEYTPSLYVPPVPAPTKNKKATGHRRNITPSNLVPVDAPTQQRSYIKPSATSRKDIPAAFATASKKRGVSEVFDDLEDAIEAKRRQNTVAARRSRARKLEYVRDLEAKVEQLQTDLAEALRRAETAEAELRGQ